jgi:PAS domain S-box-containing protein
MPEIHLDRTLKRPTRQQKDLDRTVAAAALVPLSSMAVLQSTVADINIKKRLLSERALRDSETRYRRLFETAQDGILILDAKTGSITDANPFLVELLEYSRAELLGMALWDIGLFKDVEASKNAFRELQAKQYIRYEDLPLKTRGGRCINVEFVSNVYGVNSRKVIQCNIRDITRRKEAEQLDQRLRQGQKMEAVGQLAGGWPMTSITFWGSFSGIARFWKNSLT